MQCETTKARKTPLGTRSARHSQRSVAQAFLSFTFMVRASGNSLSYEVPVANQTARPISSMQAQGVNVYSAVRRSASQRAIRRDGYISGEMGPPRPSSALRKHPPRVHSPLVGWLNGGDTTGV